MADDKFYIQVDDSAFSVGADDVSAVGMLADDTTPDSVDEGDIGIPRMTLDRKQLFVLADATTDSQRLAIDSNGSASAILAANSGVDIGDVDVTSVIPGTGATNLGKAEDAAHTTGDVGIMSLAVRDDTGTTLSSATGDYEPLHLDASGNLRTTASVTINAEKTDDSAFTVASDTVNVSGYLADDTTPDSVDEGDVGAARMTLDRKQLIVVADPTTDSQRLAIGSSGQASVAVVDPLPAGTNNIGDVDVLTVPAPLSTTGGGTQASALRVTIANDSTGLLSIDDNGGSLTIDNSTLAVVGGGTEATALRVTLANDSTGVLSIDDNSGSLTVDQATHDNFNANANIQVSDTDVSSTNPVPVTIVDPGTSTTEVHDYDTATVGAGSTSNHDYTASGGTFLLRQITLSASGGSKVELINDATGTPATLWVGFLPVGQGGTVDHQFNPAVEVASGTVLRATRTNRQGGSQDLYSTIEGNQL